MGIDSITYAANEKSLQEFLTYEENFRFLKKDICDLDYLPDCDYVINLSAETHVGNSIINSDPFMKSNVLGVQNLLNLIKDKPVNVNNKPILIQFSTDEVYSDILEGYHTETAPLKPSNPYSASKAAADMLIHAWNRTYGVDYIILRPTNNYGEYQYPEKLIPLSVKILQRGKKIRLHNKGEPKRNWLHCQDTTDAVMAVIDAGVKNEIYNIAGNSEQTNRYTVERIIDAYFQNQPVNYEDYLDLSHVREGQDVRYALDDSKLQKLGWKAVKKFDEEIPGLVQHYKRNFRW
jgi:dTDP-glucose 4,6-dehydratase